MVPNDDSKASVSMWISDLREGDERAAYELWSRYSKRLLEFARKKLGYSQNGIADEEDVAQLAFSSLCRGARKGRFADVRDRDELWWLLMAITKRKAVDLIRRETAQKRGGGEISSGGRFERGPSYLTFADIVGREPTPEYLAALAEQYARLMQSLRDDCLRQIVISRIEGYTVAEIAGQLEITKRSVERKLQLIREKWSRELHSSVAQNRNPSS